MPILFKNTIKMLLQCQIAINALHFHAHFDEWGQSPDTGIGPWPTLHVAGATTH